MRRGGLGAKRPQQEQRSDGRPPKSARSLKISQATVAVVARGGRGQRPRNKSHRKKRSLLGRLSPTLSRAGQFHCELLWFEFEVECALVPANL